MAAAWYLSKTIGNSNNYVDISIPAPVAISGQYDFSIEFEVQLTGTDLPILHASALDATVNFYFVNSSGNLDIRTTGNTTTVTVNGGDKTQWNKYRVRHYTSGGVNYRQVYYNDALKNTYTINNIPTAPILFAFKVSNAGRTGNLKTISFTDANAPENNKLYDANLSGGVGTTLPPDGTLQGTLSWVEYDDGIDPGGDTDSSVSFSVPLFGVQADQQSTIPEYGSSVSFGVGLFSVSASQSSEAPQYNSSVNLGVALFSASVLQNSQPPEHESSISFGVPLFSIAAIQEQELPAGGASVSFFVPLFGLSASQSSSVPEFNSEVQFGVPLFGALISQQSGEVSYNSTLQVSIPLFGVSVSQNSAGPEYSSSVSFGVSIFGVSIMAGDFEYFSDPSAGVDIVNLSRSADINNLSRVADVVSKSRSIDI